jgi:large subunit ribosomal protein L9
MEVILLEKVGKLGSIGDKVTVKSGYGRNFLIPKGKAIFATADNVAAFEQRRAELEQAATERRSEAEARAAKLEALGSITLTANAGDEGKLFGSIGTRDISDALNAAGLEVSKSEIKLPEGALREIGEFEVDVQFHAEVTQAIKVIVVAE